jgi:hypothetical protein
LNSEDDTIEEVDQDAEDLPEAQDFAEAEDLSEAEDLPEAENLPEAAIKHVVEENLWRHDEVVGKTSHPIPGLDLMFLLKLSY